jgi:serine phosphatase RsbU (regulator of sigma subunit)
MDTLKGPIVELGVATRALPGYAESGDLHVVLPYPNGVLVGAVDGLGHGSEAANAAKLAVQSLERFVPDAILALLKRCHDSLRGTRGVVMSLAYFDVVDETMTWTGIGNVQGILVRADPKANPGRESLLLRGGVIGGRMPLPYASVVSIVEGDTLVFATDGIDNGFSENLPLNDPPQRIADGILAHHDRGMDDALVLVSRYMGCRP